MIGTLLICASLLAVDGDTIKCNGINMRDMGDGAPFVSGYDAPEITHAKCPAELALGRKAKARMVQLLAMPGVTVTDSGKRDTTQSHRPLVWVTDDALDLLRLLYETRTNEYIFPGLKPKSHLHAASLTKALVAAGGKDFTVHGMRSSFRDWVHEETAYPDTLAEAALAHMVGDATERAYKRGDALERRREMMAAWAKYCLTPTTKNNVVPMKAAR